MVKFPQYLGSPLQILWFELDEFVLWMAFFVLGMLFHWIFFLTSFVVSWLYHRSKQESTRGFLVHSLYRLGILQLNGYPIYFETEYQE